MFKLTDGIGRQADGRWKLRIGNERVDGASGKAGSGLYLLPTQYGQTVLDGLGHG